MITIYHLETSRSERIVWLMEELGLDYALEIFPRESTAGAPSPLKAVHGLGKAPVIRDGDVVLAESGAIVEYIVHRHAGVGIRDLRAYEEVELADGVADGDSCHDRPRELTGHLPQGDPHADRRDRGPEQDECGSVVEHALAVEDRVRNRAN